MLAHCLRRWPNIETTLIAEIINLVKIILILLFDFGQMAAIS